MDLSKTAAAPPHGPPVDFAKWDRYRVLRLVGEGGGGQVWEAEDPRLRRRVALKFLHSDDPRLIARFLQEAQAQARLMHDHVCQVYEVGEQPRAYIAMQLIEGRSLGAVAREMTLEHRVQVMKLVAEAIHEAHRLGLVHRDLKPGNVLCERTADGGWKPYVMDFGLAREMDAARLTITGAVVGTPHYMAPEQARGHRDPIDARTDVYGLGATLYETLCGKPPFDGLSMIDVLQSVVHDEAAPLRKVDSSIPMDLETIVAKCLEKEPVRRYESARALADDLGRFLAGDPVSARRASLTYRLVKKARKNRAILAGVAIAAVGALGFGAVALQARLTAHERAQLAQRFGHEVERMESLLRHAYAMPLHDIRPDRARVQERMTAVAKERAQLGAIADGPAHYALGRGFLALHDWQNARRELEAAWAAGYREPEAANALGQVMGQLYRQALANLSRVDDPQRREAQRKAIQAQYREPALSWLRAGQNAPGESAAYVEGLIAFYEDRFEEALDKAKQAIAQVPWLYEGHVLAGEAHQQMGVAQVGKGDHAAALAAFERAGEEFAAAIELARSDADVYVKQCRRWIEELPALMFSGKAPAGGFDAAEKVCGEALKADPERAKAWSERAALEWRLGEWRKGRGEDPRPLLERAATDAQKALDLDPRDAVAHVNLGLANDVRGEWELYHGGDPRPWLDRAIASYQQAIALDTAAADVWDKIGTVWALRAQYEIARGTNPASSSEKAVAAFRKTIEAEPRNAWAHNNLGNVFLVLGEWQAATGHDPRASLEKAVESYRAATERNPGYSTAFNNMGAALETLGEWDALVERDPAGSLERSVAAFRKAIEINPTYVSAWRGIGLAARTQANWQFLHGLSASAALAEGRDALERAAAAGPKDPEVPLRRGQLELMAARVAGRGEFARAAASIEEAIGRNPNSGEAYASLAELHLRRAQWRASKDDLARGLLAAQKALAVDEGQSEAAAAAGALEALAGHGARAQQWFARARKINPMIEREWKTEIAQLGSSPK